MFDEQWLEMEKKIREDFIKSMKEDVKREAEQSKQLVRQSVYEQSVEFALDIITKCKKRYGMTGERGKKRALADIYEPALESFFGTKEKASAAKAVMEETINKEMW